MAQELTARRVSNRYIRTKLGVMPKIGEKSARAK